MSPEKSSFLPLKFITHLERMKTDLADEKKIKNTTNKTIFKKTQGCKLEMFQVLLQH